MASISLTVSEICPKKVVYQRVVERMVAHDWSALVGLMVQEPRLKASVEKFGIKEEETHFSRMVHVAAKRVLIEYLRFILYDCSPD
jgi:hypothetical protein